MHFWACLSNTVIQVNFTLQGSVGMLTDSMTTVEFYWIWFSSGSEGLREEFVNGLQRLSSQVTGSNPEPAWQWLKVIASWQEPGWWPGTCWSPIPAPSGRNNHMTGGCHGFNENTGAELPVFFHNSLLLTRLNMSINLIDKGPLNYSNAYLSLFFFYFVVLVHAY